ncbi:MAG: hypothetical protein ABJA50_05625 [Chloroflexota bacterium]
MLLLLRVKAQFQEWLEKAMKGARAEQAVRYIMVEQFDPATGMVVLLRAYLAREEITETDTPLGRASSRRDLLPDSERMAYIQNPAVDWAAGDIHYTLDPEWDGKL